jgi:hypothetical protein
MERRDIMNNIDAALFGSSFRRFTRSVLLTTAILLAGPLPQLAWADGQTTFDSADAAVEALLGNLASRDVDALAKLFGEKEWTELAGPDKAQAREGLESIYKSAQVAHSLVPADGGGKVLMIGPEAWPFPIPLVEEKGKWRFDTAAGMEEILNRRIGGNELSAIATMREYVMAQVRYATADRDGDAVLEYAQRINSSAGQHDGLYWASEGADESPLGPFISESADYLDGRTKDAPFKGYFFKVLSRQGVSAPGGRYDYVINGNMIGGFAMVAYPAEYGNSGIMSFIVNQQGQVYERDLGDETAALASSITEYDPEGWSTSKD